MEKVDQWIFLIIGILFLLPLINIQIGSTLTQWLVTIGFLLVGLLPFFKK